MQDHNITRRGLLKAALIGGASLAASPRGLARAGVGGSGVPAALGGKPVRTTPFPSWPNFTEADEKAVLPVLRGGVWSRSKVVGEAEKRFAQLMGADHCLATCNGTSAIFTSINALDIGPGDEVITTPYTFVGSIHPILLAGALPVFADIDPGTWQIDPAKIEAKITPKTAAILPVHILGGVCDMDRINAIAKKHDLAVIEDACEAHGGEWKGKKVGNLGDLGCFSFQTGKSLSCGEGGGDPRPRQRPDGPLLLLPRLRPRAGKRQAGAGPTLCHGGDEVPYGGVPGGDPDQPDGAVRGGMQAAERERGLS